MKCSELKICLQSGALQNEFSALYKDEDYVNRFASLCDDFLEIYGDADVSVFSAPGRVEVGGNHTDHQHGNVLAAAVNLDIIAIASTADNNIVKIKSANFPLDTIDIGELDIVEAENQQSISLIRGIAARFYQLGYAVGGFNAVTTSNVLKGSGLSSSAAFEVIVACMMSHLYNDGHVDSVEIAKISQYAENVYYGKPCGLMDQMASSVGGFVAIDFADTMRPVLKKLDFDFDIAEHSICIVDTQGDHSALTGDYASITDEMRSVSNFFNKSYLRDVAPADFYKNITELRKVCSDRAILRAAHFFSENDRAKLEALTLEQNNFSEFLSLVNQSGHSSFMYLQNVYADGENNQNLSIALCISEKILAGNGAFRVHGSGFGGTIEAFVPNSLLERYKNEMEAIFGCHSCYILNIRKSGGVKII